VFLPSFFYKNEAKNRHRSRNATEVFCTSAKPPAYKVVRGDSCLFNRYSWADTTVPPLQNHKLRMPAGSALGVHHSLFTINYSLAALAALAPHSSSVPSVVHSAQHFRFRAYKSKAVCFCLTALTPTNYESHFTFHISRKTVDTLS
jgi:hypothetical protein